MGKQSEGFGKCNTYLPQRDHVVVQFEQGLQPERVQAFAKERVHRRFRGVLRQFLQGLFRFKRDPPKAGHDPPHVHVNREVRAVKRQE
jgi:hypothetical protein